MQRRAFIRQGAARLAALALGPPTLLGAGPSTFLGIRSPSFQKLRPTPAQLAWQRDELALFLHFGINTFTDREWGDGREDPDLFSPTALDARAWAKTARAAGFRALVLTAKHHGRVLPMANQDDDAFGGEEPVAGRPRRCGTRVRRCLSRRGTRCRAVSVAVGPQPSHLR